MERLEKRDGRTDERGIDERIDERGKNNINFVRQHLLEGLLQQVKILFHSRHHN